MKQQSPACVRNGSALLPHPPCTKTRWILSKHLICNKLKKHKSFGTSLANTERSVAFADQRGEHPEEQRE
jgi:hypothetical protein